MSQIQAPVRVSPSETPHQRFQRLMPIRVDKALDKMRLVSQLSSENYKNTPAEAEQIIEALDTAVQHIAQVFGVAYSSAIGHRANKPSSQGGLKKVGAIDEIDVVKAIELIGRGQPDDALVLLKAALRGEKR